MSKKSDNNLLKNVAGVAGILIVFVIILRAALTPLYQEVGQMERYQEQQMSQNSSGGGSEGSSSGGGGSGENINIDLGGFGGLFNWALGWAWGGPGWYRGPDYGWWGANVWNGWRNWWNGGGNNRNWWNGGGNNRVWGGNVNDTYNREVNNEFRSDRYDNNRQDDRFRDNGGERREGEDFRENRPEHREGGGGFHGGESHGGGRR
jgi:hypothetical protein